MECKRRENEKRNGRRLGWMDGWVGGMFDIGWRFLVGRDADGWDGMKGMHGWVE